MWLALVLTLPALAAGSFPSAPAKLMVKLTKQRDGDLIRFFIENLEPVDITATFDLGLVNLKGSTTFPHTLSCRPREKREAFTLAPVAPGWNYTLTNYFTVGNQKAVHDDRYCYALPYAEGQTFLVSQAFGGAFSHSGVERYAIDWNMPERTEVRAARAGLVVAVRQDSHLGGPSRAFENEANYILVQHDDGTIGNYAHLTPNGARVRPGQRVECGDLLGLSGNTGFSSAPHLHFSVFRATDGKTRESIPIRFDLGRGAPMTLQAGQWYQKANAPLWTAEAALRRARE